MNHVKAYWTRIRITDPDMFAALSAEYRQTQRYKEQQKKSSKNWLDNNRERWNAYQREYARRRRESSKAQQTA